MGLVEDINDISDRVMALEHENERLRASVETLLEQLENASLVSDNRDKLIDLVAPHIERWEAHWAGERLGDKMREIIDVYRLLRPKK